MLFPNVGIKWKARREHHLVFASHIKALSSLYFDVSVGGEKKILLEAFQTLAFYQPAFPPWCVWNKQTIFYLYFQEVYIPYYCSANTQRGQKQQEIFWINASSDVLKNDSQPFSQPFTLPVNQCGKECQGPRVWMLHTLHLMMYDVLKCKI